MNLYLKKSSNMFYIKDPCTVNSPWILSKNKPEEKIIQIPNNVTKCMHNYHLMGVEFLYHNFRKGFQGSILNEEEDMNFPLQVSAFLKAVIDNKNQHVLIVCSSSTLCAWHYHLTNHADLKVVILDNTTNLNIAHSGENSALILDVHNVKLCEKLEHFDFFSVVIENFDFIANKLIIKRLEGNFKIGLTTRNFYKHPDQKLLWKMLNWANPGCVGKLNDFYETDQRNLHSLRDNYRPYWLRLTWTFCESFKKPSDDVSVAYAQTLEDWAEENSLHCAPKEKKTTRKRKPVIEDDDTNSSDTITYEVPSKDYVKLPSMDESPILTSIIKNFEASPEPVRAHYYEPSSYSYSQGNCSKAEDNNVILSFFNEDFEKDDKPSTSRSDSETFIINLINSDPDEEETCLAHTQIDNIEEFLKQTDALLQK